MNNSVRGSMFVLFDKVQSVKIINYTLLIINY